MKSVINCLLVEAIKKLEAKLDFRIMINFLSRLDWIKHYDI